MDARGRALAALRAAAWLGVLACAGPALVGCGGGEGEAPSGGAAPGPQEPSAPPDAPAPAQPAPRPTVRVAFKLDPALTGGVYMGERWVSPPVFRAAAQQGSVFRVEARVERPDGTAATWTPSDPDAVAALPATGRQVELVISRPGHSALTVRVGEHATTLAVEGVHQDGRWLVTFSE